MNVTLSRPFVFVVGTLLSLAACNRAPEPEPKPTTTTPATPGASGTIPSKPASAASLAWDVPPKWESIANPSPMRKATYRTPKAASDAEAPEMSVTQAGGSVDQNVDRWVGQFDGAAKDELKRESKKVGSLPVTIIELHGTFSGSGMPGGAPTAPKPGFALLAAIVEVEGGSWFFKLTGPDASIADARADFDKLVSSLRPS